MLASVNAPRYTRSAMILLLSGDDTYRSRERLRILRGAFRKKHDPSGLNIVRLDGAKLTADELSHHLRVQGFLSPKRFLIIENFFSQGARDEQQAARNLFTDGDASGDNILLFWEGGDAPVATRNRGGDRGKNTSRASPLR